MKFLRYLALVLVVIAIIGAIVNHKRETIAREIANSALRGRGLVATDLSIDTLATDHIVLARLVLEQEGGARYELRGLTLPLSFPSLKMERLSIDELRVFPADRSNEPPAIADLLQVFLSLPESIPNTNLVVGAVSVPEMPEIRNVDWQSNDDKQRLALRVDTAAVELHVEPADPGSHRAEVTVAAGDGRNALRLPMTVRRREDGFTVESTISLDLLPWLPLLHSAGLVPAGLTVLDASLEGPVTVEIADDGTQPITATGLLAITGARNATLAYTADDAIGLQLAQGSSLDFRVTYPGLEWNAAVAKADFDLSSGLAGTIPGHVTNLACHGGIECTMRLRFARIPFDLGAAGSGTAGMTSSVAVALGDVTKVDFLQDTQLTLSDFKSASASAASLKVSGISGAHLSVSDDHWELSAGRLNLDVQSLASGDARFPTLPLAMRSLRLQDGGSKVRFKYAMPPGTASIQWQGATYFIPGVSGTFSRVGDAVSTQLELSDDVKALSAQVALNYAIASGAGHVTVRDAALQFDRRSLSGWRINWPYAWDIVSGSWTASADLNWQTSDDGFSLGGTVAQNASDLAGHYNDIAFTGATSSLSATISPDGTLNIAPSAIHVALLDVGIPIQELSADIEPDLSNEQIAVQNLAMSVLGGKILADPFVYALHAPSNDIMFRPESIQLQFMVDLAEFKDIELSGSISGHIPLNISDKAITVTGGRLESDAPGGVIRYGAAAAAAAINNAQINLVSRALGNFQFDSLTSDVDYTEKGDLKLKMRLSGINPDMDPRQPVILNLGVENNIPQLLRSLQATRAIEDVLQKKGRN